MGRRRTKDINLPPQMRRKGNALYYDHGAHGGKRRWEPIGNMANYALALKRWAEINGSAKSETFGDIVDRYVIEIIPTKATRTQKDYTKQAKTLKAVFGHMLIGEIEPHHVAKYLDEHRAKIQANREKSLMSTMYAHAMRWGWTRFNPCVGVKRNPEKPRGHYIEDKEYQEDYKKLSPLMQCAMDFAYMSGLRKADMLKVILPDDKDEGISITTGKTGKKLFINLTPELRAVIQRIKGLNSPVKSVFLFCNRRGQPYTTGGFDAIWQREKRKNKITFVWHDLRAKHASDFNAAGGNATMNLGHNNPQTTTRYLRKPTVVEPLKKK